MISRPLITLAAAIALATLPLDGNACCSDGGGLGRLGGSVAATGNSDSGKAGGRDVYSFARREHTRVRKARDLARIKTRARLSKNGNSNSPSQAGRGPTAPGGRMAGGTGPAGSG